MSGNPIKVSVIIPLYATEAYLESCLCCAMRQTLNEIEIILVDDASPDNSLSIAKKYGRLDPRIKILEHTTNQGLAQTRLTGVTAARGDYVAFCDSDDEFSPDYVENLYHIAVSENADIVQGRSEIISELSSDSLKSHLLEERLMPYSGVLLGAAIFESFFVNQTHAYCLWGKLFKRHLWKNANQELEASGITMGEDLYLYTYVALKAKKYVGTSVNGYRYFFGRGISSVVYSKNQKFDTLIKWQKYLCVHKACELVEELLLKRGLLELYQAVFSQWRSLFFNACCDNFRLVSAPLKGAAFEALCSAWGYAAIVDNFQKQLDQASDKIQKIESENKIVIQNLELSTEMQLKALEAQYIQDLKLSTETQLKALEAQWIKYLKDFELTLRQEAAEQYLLIFQLYNGQMLPQSCT